MFGGEVIEYENFFSIVNDIGLLYSFGICLVVVYGVCLQIDVNLVVYYYELLYYKNICVIDVKILELVKQVVGIL